MTIALPPLGVGEILTASILLCIAYSMHFCGVIIYMVFMFQDAIQYFSTIGLLIQRGEFAPCFKNPDPSSKDKDVCNPFVMVMLILFLVFSVAAITVSFFAYRIFKAQSMGQLAGAMNVGGVLNQGDHNRRDYDDEAAAPMYQAP